MVALTSARESCGRLILPNLLRFWWRRQIPQPQWPGADENIGSGVKVAAIVNDDAPTRMVYDPSHPDADKNGYVAMPNVNVVEEMVDMITATRAYEANATAFNSTKQMLQKALDL